MAKAPTLPTITNQYASSGQLNQAFRDIEDAFENTLSRDGSVPNTMSTDLDLNGNNLLNVGTIDVDDLTISGQQVTDLASVPEWRSTWTSGITYTTNDLVKEGGDVYICLVPHVAGTFATDLTALRWEIFVQRGAAGAGTGDMLRANNLSDVTNIATARSNLGLGTLATQSTAPVANGGTGATDAATARTNLGLAIGTNVQAYDASLQSLSGLSLAAGDILYATAADTLQRLPAGTENHVLTMVGGIPDWEPTKGNWDYIGEYNTITGGVIPVTTGLSGYKHIRVHCLGLTASVSGQRVVQFSTDGGSTYLTTAIYYEDETPTAITAAQLTAAASTAKNPSFEVIGFATTNPVKSLMNSRNSWIIQSSSAFNAFRIANGSGNITGGSVYVWGMRTN